MSPRTLLLWAVLANIAFLPACRESTDPNGRRLLRSGEAVTGMLAFGTADTFQIDLPQGSHLRVWLQLRQTSEPKWVGVRVFHLSAAGRVTIDFGAFSAQSLVSAPSDLIEIPLTGRYTVVISSTSLEENAYTGEYQVHAAVINTAPEHASATVETGESVTTEVLDEREDIDDFRITGAVGTEVNLFIRGEMGSAADTVVLESFDQGLYVPAMSPGNDTRPDGQPIGTLRLTSTTSPVYRVRGLYGHEEGRYILTAYRIDRAPEGQSAILAVPSTIDSRIDREGDIDEYTIQGAAGGLYNVFLQPLTGSGQDTFVVEIENPVGDVIVRREILGNTQTLYAGAAGRFVATSGTKVRIRGKTSRAHRGDYRLSIIQIDPAPETAAAALPFGSVVTESIDVPGDVDQFTITGTPGQAVNVFIRARSATSMEPVAAEMIMDNPVDFQTAHSTSADASIYSRAIGRVVLPASGTRTVRVLGLGTGGDLAPSSLYTGPYDILAVALSDAPEGRAAAVAIGDVVTEALDPPGDIDVYTFQGTAGQMVNVFMQHTTTNPPEGIRFTVHRMGSDAPPIAFGFAGVSTVALRQTSGTGAVMLPATGTYRITVESQGAAGNPTAAIPYRFEIFPINIAPEVTGAMLTVGGMVTEALDLSGDVDEFRITGTPGQHATVCLTMTSTTADYNFYARIFDGATELAATIHHRSQPAPGCSQTFTFPASGAVKVRVSGHSEVLGTGGSAGQTGGYKLEVQAR